MESDEAVDERNYFYIIRCGPRGVKWLHFDRVIDENNPLMFTCGICKKTTGSYPYNKTEDLHEVGCLSKLLGSLGL
jgi:hypothetical protein